MYRFILKLARSTAAACALLLMPLPLLAQDNPYRLEAGWAKYPTGRTWGSTLGVEVDRAGNVWAFERCGARDCSDSKLETIFQFDRNGNIVKSFGGDMFVFPHGVALDREGNVYVTDADGKNGKDRGEFDGFHAIALDSQGRVFVGDRGNGLIKIFDAEGNLLDEWKQFGRPSGLYIDAADNIYVTDSQSDAKRNPGVRRGIRVGSAKDGSVRALIPGVGPAPDKESVPEGVAADAAGVIYGAETSAANLLKYVRK